MENEKDTYRISSEPFWISTLLVLIMAALFISDKIIAAANPWKGFLAIILGGGVFLVLLFYWFRRHLQAIHDLEEAKERFQIVSQATNDGIWDWNLKSGRSWRNPGFARLFGYQPEQIVDNVGWWEERIHPEDRQKVVESIRTVIENGQETWQEEYRFRRADGTYAHVLDRGYLMRDRQGNPTRMLGAILDITTWRETEAALRRTEEKYRSIYENAIEGIYQSTPDGRILSANPALARMFGYASPEEMIAEMNDLANHFYVQPGRRAEFIQLLEQKGTLTGFESEVLRKDGSTMWISENAHAVRDSNGKIQYYEGTIEDVTARKQAEQELQDANQKQAIWIRELERYNREVALLHTMSDSLQTCATLEDAYAILGEQMRLLFPEENGILYMLDSRQNLLDAVIYWGVEIAEPMLFKPKECWGLKKKSLHVVEKWAQPPGKGTLTCRHLPASQADEYVCMPLMAQGEIIGLLHLRRAKDSTPSETDEVWFPPHKQDLIQTVANSLALVLANLKLREELRQQSIRDPLTGLFNRRYLEESLEREIHRAERNNHPVGVIMLDIDHFKQYNDTYGHEAGDIVLRELGAYLASQIRAGDIACRYGGEEFILILPEASLEVTAERAERIRLGARKLNIKINNISLGEITLSVGVAAFPEHGLNGASVIRSADEALYQAKQMGRNRVIVAQSDEQAEFLEKQGANNQAGGVRA